MGGFFDGGASPKTPKPNRKANTSGVNEQAPGGFFQGGADPKAPNNAASSATDSKFWAEQSKGWAVGIDEEGLTDWSRTNNSKAYAEDAEESANSASESAQSAAADSDSAKLNAQAAARDKTLAEEAATRAKSWAVGPGGANTDGTDTDNAKYWAEQAESHGGNGREWARDAQGWAVGDTDDPLGGWTDSDNAKSYAEAAETSRIQAANSATTAAQQAEIANTARDGAENAEHEAESAAGDAQGYRDEALIYAQAADSDRQLAEAAATAADSDALVAKSWAVGPSGTGSSGTDTNNAHYWALVAMDAASFDSVQYDFEVDGDAIPGISYSISNRQITVNDSDLYVEEPLISYNGVVLSDGEHYSVTNGGATITFTTGVSPQAGDNITVTGGAERNKLDAEFFIAGDGITIADSDSKVKISASATGVDYDALKDIITAGENVTIDTDDTNETLTINSTASGGGGSSYAMAETVEIHYTGATWANGVGISNTDTTNVNGWIDWTGFTTQAPTGWTAKDTENDEGGFGVDSIVFTNGTSDDVTVHRIDLITEGYEGSSSGYSVRIYNNGSSIIGNHTIQGSTNTPGVFHTVMDSDWNSDFPDAGITIAAGNKMSFSLSNVGIQLKVLSLGLSFQSDKTPFDFAGTGGTRNVTATRFTKLPVAFTHDLYWNGISVTGDTDQADYTWTSRR